MTTSTVVTIATRENGQAPRVSSITVGEQAQKHVLRSFNPTENDETKRRVDATKVLCAALIQQMLDLRDTARDAGHTDDGDLLAACIAQIHAADRAIELIEAAQMQAVKANFAQA